MIGRAKVKARPPSISLQCPCGRTGPLSLSLYTWHRVAPAICKPAVLILPPLYVFHHIQCIVLKCKFKILGKLYFGGVKVWGGWFVLVSNHGSLGKARLSETSSFETKHLLTNKSHSLFFSYCIVSMRLAHRFYQKGFKLYAKTGCFLPSRMTFFPFLVVFVMQPPKKRASEFVLFNLWKAPVPVGHTIYPALPPSTVLFGLIPIGIASIDHLQEPGTALIPHNMSMELCFVSIITT